MPSLYYLDDTGRLVLTATARARIKTATRELRDRLGLTLPEIAERTHASKSAWHNYENVNVPDLIPAHVYLPLELQLGEAPITRAYASLNGLTVASAGDGAARTEAADLMAAAAKEFGEAFSAFVQAFADGRATPNEAKTIAAEFAQLGQVVERVQHLVASIIGGEP